jgi:hypothetical protein
MKKFILPLSIFVNLTFVIIACSKMDATAPANGPSAQAGTPGNESGRVSSFTGSATECTGAYQGLSYNQVIGMINNYRLNQAEAIRSRMGIEDARSCWFSLAEVKNFVCHLEAAVASNNCVNPTNLGIRFYYGAHGNPPTMAGIPANYAKLHNLILIPTYRDGKGTNVDFDPYYINGETCTPLPLGLMDPNTRMNAILFGSNEADGNSFSMDHGQLFPPYQ